MRSLLFFILFCCGISMKATESDGLKYVLYSDHTAMITNDNQWEGELDIPEQVTYKGEVYTVNSLE